MKTLQELLLCVEDDIELMGLSHIIYLLEKDGQTVDYDYLPSELYTEAVTLKELQDELLTRSLADTAPKDVPSPSPKQKLAVFFPGIGYTCDKPLLYFSEKLALAHKYSTYRVPYGGFAKNIKGNKDAMAEAFSSALLQAEDLLAPVDWSQYDDILFVSKSIGTVIATAYADRHALSARHILFTPLCETFSHIKSGQLAFHGTADPWAVTDDIQDLARQTGTLLFLTPDANHSLETGDILADLNILQTVMKQTEPYMMP